MSIYNYQPNLDNQEPIGNPFDLPFSVQDMLDVLREFPTSTDGPISYAANGGNKVECTPSVFNPAIQWCSTRVDGEMHFDPFSVGWTEPVQGIPVVGAPEHSHVTPEPSMLWVLATMMLTALLLRRWMVRS